MSNIERAIQDAARAIMRRRGQWRDVGPMLDADVVAARRDARAALEAVNYAGAVDALRHIAESAKHPSPTVNTSDYLGHAAEQALKRLGGQ